MGIFDNVFRRNLDIKESVEFNLETEPATRAYLKRIALETNINFIARTMSQSKFWFWDNGRLKKNPLYYRLNVSPNTDSSASDFWHKVIYKLVYDNEVLIIKDNDDNLLIADDFGRKEYTMYDDLFVDVTVKDYKFERQFFMDEVIYLTYNNEKLERYINQLFADYGELFGRMMDSQLRNNQLRFKLNIKGGAGKGPSKDDNIVKKRIEVAHNALKNDSVAIIPESTSFELNEMQNNTSNQKDNSAENLHKLKKVFIEDVAKMIGIPPTLIHSDMADLSNAMDAYLTFCIDPLIKKIEDELNKKLIGRRNFLRGQSIEVIGINKRDPLKNAESIDKNVSSGTFSRNEMRTLHGYEPKDGLDEMVLTKNYQEDNQPAANDPPPEENNEDEEGDTE